MSRNPERVVTEARSQDAQKTLGVEQGRILTELRDFLGVNADVEPYTAQEAQVTAEKLTELCRTGLDGILHIVTSPTTSQYVRQAMPQELRPFLHELYYKMSGVNERLQPDPEFSAGEGAVININKDGTFASDEDEKNLYRLLRDRVGFLIGGGPGYPQDSTRRPLLRALEEPLKSGTGVCGVCLGHQDVAEIMGLPFVPGVINVAQQIEHPTTAGKTHPVVGRLGESFGAMMFNSGVVVVNQDQARDWLHVLSMSQSAGGRPVTLGYDVEHKDQIITSQAHQEIPVGPDNDVELLTQSEDIDVPGEKEKVHIPKGTPNGVAQIVRYSVEYWEQLFKPVGLKVEDVQAILNKERLYPRLGRNYFGPVMDMLASNALTYLHKRK